MKFKHFLVLAAFMTVALFSCSEESQLDEDLDDIKSFLSTNHISAEKYQNIYYEVLKEGTGDQCEAGDIVAFKYTLWSISDTTVVIDKSTNKAFTCTLPATIPNSAGEIITGLQIGLTTMKVGGISRFYIPSPYAYGSKEINGETYANLLFEVELCEIKTYGSKH
jgi:FKBP-type peptidyl-prolyl cis-trans isomerase